jgi:hypothetical protein
MLFRRAWTGIARRPPVGVLAFAGYTCIAFVYFGLPLLVKHGSQYVGQGDDPEFFVWALAWWPHAILHGENPFFNHAVWAPDGVNLTWTTAVPGLALVLSPLTVIAGPVSAYNVAATLMPALAAWTAFALCRYLTRAVWPSLVGGYLFGFSSYVVVHAAAGHLNLTSVFLLPLIALVVLRFLNEELTGVGLILRLGPLLAFQLLLSTEVTFTLTLALAVALVLSLGFFPTRRRRVRSLVPHLLGAYALAVVLTEPFVYYLVADSSRAVIAPGTFVADLGNLVVPTSFALVAGDTASALVKSFPAVTLGQEAYLGLPALVVIGLSFWELRRVALGRFLLVCFAVALVAPLGAHASVFGRRITALPWTLVNGWPLLDDIQPVRFSLYLSLVSAVAVALWTARRRAGELRAVLPVLAVLGIAANPIAGAWASDTSVPPFFTSSAYRGCLDPGETILPLPIGQGSAMLWQAEDNFRFDMAGGYVGPYVPASFMEPGLRYITIGSHLGPQQARIVRAFVAAKHVTTIVVDQDEAPFFSGALNKLATPETVGGVVLYNLAGALPSCPGA